jgi:signal transduction histidine kinase
MAPQVLRRARPPRLDIALACGLVIVVQVDVWVLGAAGGGLGGALTLSAMAVTIAWRRSAPLVVGVMAIGWMFLTAVFFGAPGGISSLLCVWIAFFTIGAMTDRRRAGVGLVFGIVVSLFMNDSGTFDLNLYLAIALTSFVAPWTVGAFWWRRRRIVELESKVETNAREAVDAERARLAREIHDVVSHNISMIVVQAAAADVLLDDSPHRSRRALHEIEAGARNALVEMRQMLHLLHPGATPDLEPAPRLADLDALVTRVRASGLSVELEIDGDPRPVSAITDLTAYRVVQEGLTNILKHAGPCTATVRVAYGDDLAVEVTDTGRGVELTPSTGGFGLTGLDERVREAGGGMKAGPHPLGGFELLVRLPLIDAA